MSARSEMRRAASQSLLMAQKKAADMATARINIKSIDYFKFKKLIIDGNRDDYNSCSKEVKSLCDCVQTLNFRDEEFDDVMDRGRFEEICVYYKQILTSKRIDALDMRIKSGWWGDHKNAYSAGKIKPAALKELLTSKAKNWVSRHGDSLLKEKQVSEKIEGPGLYVFKHREHQCFQYVGMAERIFATCGEKLKSAFEGSSQDPLAALLIISMERDWDFYFIPVDPTDGDKVLRVLENDLILKHDCIWPHGLNFRLSISSLLEVSEFRKSCLRHHWPPEADVIEAEINLPNLREQILKAPLSPASSDGGSVASVPSDKSCDAKPDRPKSAKSGSSTKGSKPAQPTSPPTETPSKSPKPSSPRKLPAIPKSASPAKRPQSAKSSKPAAKEDKAASLRKSQKTPEPAEEVQSTPEEEEAGYEVEEVKPPPRKPVKKPSPKEESVPESKMPQSTSKEETEDQPKEEVSSSPEEKPSPNSGSPEETPKPGPLKRSGTYEILPTEDGEELVENGDVNGETQEKSPVAARPKTLERPSSRLPVSKN